MTRALAFIALRLLEVCLAFVFPLAPTPCLAVAWALDPLHERLRPREPFDLDDYAAVLAAGREATDGAT